MKTKIMRGLAIGVIGVLLLFGGTVIAIGDDGNRSRGMMGDMMDMEGMMGGKGMIGMMGMRACPMMGKGIKMEVKKLDDGVTITYRSADKKGIKRLQIMGEMMMLMQEMMELRTQEDGK